MDTQMLVDMFESLSEENQLTAYEFIRSLAEEEAQQKAEHTQRIFEEVHAILDGDTGWASEEEMIADLAEFRRQREAERSSHGGE